MIITMRATIFEFAVVAVVMLSCSVAFPITDEGDVTLGDTSLEAIPGLLMGFVHGFSEMTTA